MGIFDDAYDTMSWREVCYRLPSSLAEKSLKKRITNLTTLKMFFDNVGKQPFDNKDLKNHINNIFSKESIDDIKEQFNDDYERVLFNWLNKENIERFKSYDKSKLSLKFLFNITDSKDADGLYAILSKILSDGAEQSKIRAVFRKADNSCLGRLIDLVIKDSRPEVRVNVLSTPGLSESIYITDLQRIIGLKALAKCENNPDVIGKVEAKIFSNLRPLERLQALEKYLSYFPEYKKISPFTYPISDEEFEVILFAGCVEHNELVTKIHEMYNKITKEDEPESDDEE